MSKITKLALIRNERDCANAKSIRRHLYGSATSSLHFGGDVRGFALVVWSKTGKAATVIHPGGPVNGRLLPSFVKDVLSQHVAADLAEQVQYWEPESPA